MIYDPTRTFFLKLETIEVEPTKEPKWYQKIWRSFLGFLESDFVFYTTIVLLRMIQVGAIVFAIYFLQGGRL